MTEVHAEFACLGRQIRPAMPVKLLLTRVTVLRNPYSVLLSGKDGKEGVPTHTLELSFLHCYRTS